MGVNDAREQLEVAKAEVVRLEKELTRMRYIQPVAVYGFDWKTGSGGDGMTVSEAQQRGYDAVYAYIRGLEREDVYLNAYIWRAVEAYRLAANDDTRFDAGER